MINPEAQIPQSMHFSTGSFLMNWAKKPPTNASPAELVSIIFSDSILGTDISANLLARI